MCIRLATYESQAEADFMAKLYTGKSGAVENTTFVVLAPNGQTKLTRAGRGPFVAYRSGSSMAKGLNEIAKKYDRQSDNTNAALPYTDTVRLGVNLAASDNQPLVIVFYDTLQNQKLIESKLMNLAWKDPSIGKFVFAKTSDAASLKMISGTEGLEPNSILFVSPDKFGQKGKMTENVSGSATVESISGMLVQVSDDFQRIRKDHRSHVQEGIDAGVEWTSKIKVTDAQAESARKRKRGESSGKQSQTQDGGPGDRGSPDRLTQRDDASGNVQRSKRFVERAMEFDADGDGKLDSSELAALANEISAGDRKPRSGRSSENGVQGRDRSRRPPPNGERGRRGGGRPQGQN